MRVDHGRANVSVAEQLLHSTNIVPCLQQMGGERVTQRVTTGVLGDTRRPHRLAKGALNDRLVQMMPPLLRRRRMDIDPRR